MIFNPFGGEGKVPTGTYVDHTHGSPRYDTSDIINFGWDFTYQSKDSFYIDDALRLALSDERDGEKYGWLLESKAVIPDIYTDFIKNISAYMNIFRLVFTSDYEIYSLHDRIKFVPANTLWVKNPKIYKKSKLVSMISSSNSNTDGHRLRLFTMDKFRNKIDLYGRHINPIPMKEFGLKQYMFSIAIENSSYPTYFTEKILDCFATGTIPIYWGAPDIGDHFNSDGIIVFHDSFDISTLSEELYYSKLEAIKDNYERSLDYKVLENYIYKRYFNEN